MQLTLELRQEHKLSLKLKQTLSLRLALVIPEFKDLITFEDDEDLALLEESFPYLMLHELSHPLHRKGSVYIPNAECEGYLKEQIERSEDFSNFYVHATEVGIDRSAMTIGESACGYSARELVTSSIALTERVYRDVLTGKIRDLNYSFIARLDAELRIHEKRANPTELDTKIKSLLSQVERYISQQGVDISLYNAVVSAYTSIYENTVVSPGRGKIPGPRDRFRFH